MESPLVALVAFLCLGACAMWVRSARYRLKVLRRIEVESSDGDLRSIAKSDFRKDCLAALVYFEVACACAVAATTPLTTSSGALVLIGIPAVCSLVLGRNFVNEARLEHGRSELERRAQEVLAQDHLAPRRWAERLAPESLPDIAGLDFGRIYEAGSGLMAGDFFDVASVGGGRVAAVIGDVSGHGIDPAITAFQAKYLLRLFLRQYRDPAQALEQLNAQMSELGLSEEFISLCVVIFDLDAATLRYASAGHPPMWIWHDHEVSPLRATGPLLMLDREAVYTSREVRLDSNDLCLLYTDGLAEARSGENLFGEDRIAALLRRDPGVSPDVLCKTLLESAKDFSSGPMRDDVAILAIRRT
ncbi:MAG: PP2C family protein-serine/threonine phosphatase [Actinomycetes bacterium]